MTLDQLNEATDLSDLSPYLPTVMQDDLEHVLGVEGLSNFTQSTVFSLESYINSEHTVEQSANYCAQQYLQNPPVATGNEPLVFTTIDTTALQSLHSLQIDPSENVTVHSLHQSQAADTPPVVALQSD